MTTQYNVNIIGNLTNTNGVLSNFSTSNYATFEPFTAGANPYEIVFKFKYNNSGTEQIIWYCGLYTASYGTLSLRITNTSKFYIFFGKNNTPYWDINGTTTLQTDTDYWVKLVFNGNNQYYLYLSTDGVTYSSEGSRTSSEKLGDTNTTISQIGIIDRSYPFQGTIDLNESYIKLNGLMWWRGAQNITHIQLRRDTAANWTTVNPVLLEGEVGLELDTGKSKRGDGTTAWNSLAYDLASTALQSITSSDVTTALGYTPTDINLSNLSATGQTVLDGQWTTLSSEVKVNYTLGAGASESWTISGLPNDSYTYEVMGTVTASGTNPAVNVKSAIVNTNLCRTVSLSGQSSTFTIPIGTDHKIGLSNANSTTSVTINYLRIYAYRRIGTNS